MIDVTRVPSDTEYRLVARCMLENGILIGSHAELWGHGSAWLVLLTMRQCIEAITELIGGGHGVQKSFVKSCVMQMDGVTSVPYHLEDITEFLIDDSEARAYWQSLCTDDRYPHRCPACGMAAFIGFLLIDCKGECP